MHPAGATARTGNKRGFGSNLREEVVEAAERLLAAAGSQSTVTLRGIAREAGVAAPSIYPHFADRDAILDVVVERSFQELTQTCATAASSATPGPEEVRAISFAYLRFAREHAGRYRILFERGSPNIASPAHPYPQGLQAFDLLVQAFQHVVAGDPASRSAPVLDSQSLMVALHGIATLRPALPGFPWEDEDLLVDNLVSALTAARVARTPRTPRTTRTPPTTRRAAGR